MPAIHTPLFQGYLDRLREIAFVKGVSFSEESAARDRGIDGFVTVKTLQGKQVFIVAVKRSYLDSGILHSLIAQANRLRNQHKKHLLVFARYVPVPSAEKLISAGINFLDDAGNTHLKVGNNYERTVIGLRQDSKRSEQTRLTAAVVQLLFTFAADSTSANWTVRQLAEASRVGKSNVSKIRRQLVDRGVLGHTQSGFQILNQGALQDQLLQGYEYALRPMLLLGRFRSAEGPETIVPAIRVLLADQSVKWSLTGGPAAFELQHFYRGTETPVFVERWPESMAKRLRLIPDKSGPLLILRSFGNLPFWKQIGDFTVAHPWLIYAELMSSQDPRAHEAAQELKNEFLSGAHA